MHPAALWATALVASGGGASTSVSATLSSSTMPVAIVGGLSVIVVALIPEFFRWLRRHTPDPETPTSVVTPAALAAAEARITLAVEGRCASALERANSARSEVRALRRVLEDRDGQFRDDLQGLRDELNRHLWTVPEPRPAPEGAPGPPGAHDDGRSTEGDGGPGPSAA